MKEQEFGDKLLSMISDPKVSATIIADIVSESEATFKQMDADRLRIDDETDIDKLRAYLRNTMLALSKTNVNIYNLAMFISVYVVGGDFDGDAAKFLTNIGRGPEAMKAMLKAKMNNGS